jgi:DNA uptake protein ComE-like DNA-binding protein
MLEYLGDLERRNGTAYLELAAITLARDHFKSLDDLARTTGTDAAKVEALEDF